MKSTHYFLSFLLFNLIFYNQLMAQTMSQTANFRIQFEALKFQQYATKNYVIYYQQESDSLAKYIVENIQNDVDELEDSTQMRFSQKLNIIVYNSTLQSSQTNIGQLFEQSNPSITYPFKGNRIVLNYKGNRTLFLEDLKYQLAKQMMQENFYGSKWEEIKRNVNKVPIEDWFLEGATAYICHGWDTQMDNDWKQLLLILKAKTFDELATRNAELVGNAFFFFIERKYGSPLVYQWIYQTKQKKDIAKACKIIFKKSIFTLQDEFLEEEVQRYLQDNQHQQKVTEIKLKIPLNEKNKTIDYSNNSTVLFNENSIIYRRQNKNKLELILESIDKNNNRIQTNLYQIKKEKSDQEFRSCIAIDPFKHNRIAYTFQDDNELKLLIITLNDKQQIIKKQVQIIDELDGVNSISFTETQNKLLLSAYKNGQTDLHEYNLNTKKATAFTDDFYDEHEFIPIKAEPENGYLFLSNNPSDTFFHKNIEWQKNNYKKLFFVTETELNKIKNSKVGTYFATSLPNPKHSKIKKFGQQKDDKIIFISNENGINNLYETTIENGKFTEPNLITNSQFGTHDFALKNDTLVLGNYIDSLTLIPLHKPTNTAKKKTNYLQYQEKKTKAVQLQEEANNQRIQATETSLFQPFKADSTEISLYKDSLQKAKTFQSRFSKKYKLQLTSEFLSAQLDNTLFVNQYQPYQYNQGQFHQAVLGGIAKYTYADIFEDHKTTLGFRMPSTGKGSDFFYEYDNYKNRIDWGFSYFRHVEKFSLPNDTNWTTQQGVFKPSNVKQKTHYAEVRAFYPFSKHQALKMTLAYRRDKQIYTATDLYSLTYPDTNQTWLQTRIEWLYNKISYKDNYTPKGIQTRLFMEYHSELSSGKKSFMNWGMNFIYYQPIYKQLVWANRLQAGMSGGESDGMLYILGGVKNQLAPLVDSNVQFSNKETYQYMIYVGGLRGYAQNSRTGNNYVLLNSELRFPIMSYLKVKTPLQSINTLQLVAFSDLGNAWNPSYTKPTMAISYGGGIRTNLAGYYLRIDCAFRNQTQNNMNNPMFHFALGKDW